MIKGRGNIYITVLNKRLYKLNLPALRIPHPEIAPSQKPFESSIAYDLSPSWSSIEQNNNLIIIHHSAQSVLKIL
jgi:hypothetical protein